MAKFSKGDIIVWSGFSIFKYEVHSVSSTMYAVKHISPKIIASKDILSYHPIEFLEEHCRKLTKLERALK